MRETNSNIDLSRGRTFLSCFFKKTETVFAYYSSKPPKTCQLTETAELQDTELLKTNTSAAAR